MSEKLLRLLCTEPEKRLTDAQFSQAVREICKTGVKCDKCGTDMRIARDIGVSFNPGRRECEYECDNCGWTVNTLDYGRFPKKTETRYVPHSGYGIGNK